MRAGLADLFSAPDGYEVLLGNGGSTAFWDMAAYSLIERRSENLAFGEFGAKFAARVRRAVPREAARHPGAGGQRADVEVLEGIDLYAWTHNERSTGVMAPDPPRRGRPGRPHRHRRDVRRGRILFDAAETDVTTSPRRKNLASDGGLWFALVSPAAIERIERIAASDRYIPEILSLKTRSTTAASTRRSTRRPSRRCCCSRTSSSGSTARADSPGRMRARASRRAPLRLAERSSVATPFVTDPADRSQVVVTIDFTDDVDAAALCEGPARPTASSTPSRTASSAATSADRHLTAIEPDDVRALIESLDWVLDHLDAGAAA